MGFPVGMITLDADGGAFRQIIGKKYVFSLFNTAEHEFSKSLPFILHHVMPAEFSGFGYTTTAKKNANSAPNQALQTAPFWDDVNTMVSKRYKYDDSQAAKCGASKDECRTVAFFNQYTRGADPYKYGDGVDWWGTPTISSELKALAAGYELPLSLDTAEVMDKSAAEEAVGFIGGYFGDNNMEGKRKRFPSVFSVYLSGLDHEAHINGLGGYRDYFLKKTDKQIKNIVKALKDKDEYDNKIFIVVSDHGETQMPVDLTYEKTEESVGIEGNVLPIPNLVELPIDMSCSLKTNMDNEDVQLSESANNNLHIWELANMFQQLGQTESLRLLVPREIEQVILTEFNSSEVTAVTSDINLANVITSLNGPMAHFYVKGANGWDETNSDAIMLGKVADKLNMYFAENGVGLRRSGKELFPRLLASIDKILIRVNGNYKVFKGLVVDEDGNIIGLATPGPL